MRRIRLTITAETSAHDDRPLSGSVADTIKMVAGLPDVRDGCSPYARGGSLLYAGKDAEWYSPPTQVTYACLARFKWWHFLLPDWALRHLVDLSDPLAWLKQRTP